MTTMLLFMLACASEPPSVLGVDPSSGEAGTAITVTGAHLDAKGATYKLGGKALGDVAVVDASKLTATVPEGLKAGPLSLVVTAADGNSRSLSDVFTLVEPAPSDPCDPSIKRMTHIPPTADVVKIDLYRGEEVDRQQLATRDITRIEYEVRVGAKGKPCASIWLATADSRVLFDADTTQPLRKQAQKIANGLSKPLEVVHEDEWPVAEEAGD